MMLAILLLVLSSSSQLSTCLVWPEEMPKSVITSCRHKESAIMEIEDEYDLHNTVPIYGEMMSDGFFRVRFFNRSAIPSLHWVRFFHGDKGKELEQVRFLPSNIGLVSVETHDVKGMDSNNNNNNADGDESVVSGGHISAFSRIKGDYWHLVTLGSDVLENSPIALQAIAITPDHRLITVDCVEERRPGCSLWNNYRDFVLRVGGGDGGIRVSRERSSRAGAIGDTIHFEFFQKDAMEYIKTGATESLHWIFSNAEGNSQHQQDQQSLIFDHSNAEVWLRVFKKIDNDPASPVAPLTQTRMTWDAQNFRFVAALPFYEAGDFIVEALLKFADAKKHALHMDHQNLDPFPFYSDFCGEGLATTHISIDERCSPSSSVPGFWKTVANFEAECGHNRTSYNETRDGKKTFVFAPVVWDSEVGECILNKTVEVSREGGLILEPNRLYAYSTYFVWKSVQGCKFQHFHGEAIDAAIIRTGLDELIFMGDSRERNMARRLALHFGADRQILDQRGRFWGNLTVLVTKNAQGEKRGSCAMIHTQSRQKLSPNYSSQDVEMMWNIVIDIALWGLQSASLCEGDKKGAIFVAPAFWEVRNAVPEATEQLDRYLRALKTYCPHHRIIALDPVATHDDRVLTTIHHMSGQREISQPADMGLFAGPFFWMQNEPKFRILRQAWKESAERVGGVEVLDLFSSSMAKPDRSYDGVHYDFQFSEFLLQLALNFVF